MNNTKDLIANSGVAFGTSGARGLVTDFTPDVCAAFAVAFASVMQQDKPFKLMAIAIDNRPSSYAMAQAITAGLAQLNITAVYYGVIPTPALAYYAMQQGYPCIMVTGSHIPFDRNGLKFYRPEGEITKADEIAIINASVPLAPVTQLPMLKQLAAAKNSYIERNTQAFPEDILVGKRIGIYEHSSAGRDLYRTIFEKLGAEVISLGRSDEFVPIDTEAVSDEDKQRAKIWVAEHKLDALFSTDGDGDRPLLSDEDGVWLRGDVLGLLCSKILKIEALATPVSCNTAIEESCLFKHVVRTKIGSPFVIEAFSELEGEYNSIAGFEANGGYLLASEVNYNNKCIRALPTRDAVLPVITILSQLHMSKIGELIAGLPKRFTASDRIKDFPREKSLTLISNITEAPTTWLPNLGLKKELVVTDKTDGFRMTFSDGDIVHLRPSGNAPELRCYAESSSEENASSLVHKVLSSIAEQG